MNGKAPAHSRPKVRLAKRNWSATIMRPFFGSGPCVNKRSVSSLQEKSSFSDMIRRFLCLLLVPLMLANQGLCLAHSHQGTDVAEPAGHASRPHLHVVGQSHHESTYGQEHDGNQSHDDHPGRDQRSGDSDAVVTLTNAPIGGHDTTAVYFSKALDFARDTASVIVFEKFGDVPAILAVAHQNDDRALHYCLGRGQPASFFDAACPIYLRTHSLRI